MFCMAISKHFDKGASYPAQANTDKDGDDIISQCITKIVSNGD